MSNDRIELSSIITISKSLPYRSLHDVRRKIIADKALEKSDAYLQQPTIQIGDRRAKDIIRQLRNRIETTLKKSKDEQEDIRTQAIAHALPRIAKISTELATIPEETNNIVKTDEFQQLTKLATNGISNGHSKEADQAEEDEEEEALALKAIPFVVSIGAAWTVLWLGAYIFQLLDEVAAQKPLYLVMFYTLQVACTIGWGDIVATNSISRVYTVAYTLLGAPVVFSGFANIGKVFDRNYTPDWQFLANVVRQKDPRKKTKVEMPYMKSINLLVWHTFIVCLINTEWIQNIGNINTAYFIITSEATVGMGDYLPNPHNFLESCVGQAYMVAGIILISYWFACFQYWYQRCHFVLLRRYLHYLYKEYRVWRKHSQAIKHDDVNILYA